VSPRGCFTCLMKEPFRHPDLTGIAGALVLTTLLISIASLAGGWFYNWFYLWATPVALAYWGAWKTLVIRYDDRE